MFIDANNPDCKRFITYDERAISTSEHFTKSIEPELSALTGFAPVQRAVSQAQQIDYI
jgi:hypothetical protein